MQGVLSVEPWLSEGCCIPCSNSYGCTVWCKRIGRVSENEGGQMLFRVKGSLISYIPYNRGYADTDKKVLPFFPLNLQQKQHRGCANL